MKVTAAAVLLSLSSASAFSVSYLNNLSTGAAVAPSGGGLTSHLDTLSRNASPAPSGRGMSSYLDSMSKKPELVSALESAAPVAAAPAPVATAPAPAAPTAKAGATIGANNNYLSVLARGSNQPSGSGITGYLDALKSTAATPVSGAGMTSYLDSFTPKAVKAAPAAPAPAAPVAAAPAAPVAKATPAAAKVGATIGANPNYLSSLNTVAPVAGGAGLQGYLSSLPTNAPIAGGAGLQGYLSTLKTNAAATTGAGLTGYLDALASNSAIAGPGAASITSFLESVYAQIMELPEGVGSRYISGDTVTFAKANGSMAISFVKK